MVKFIANGDVANNQKDGLIGYPSFFFDLLGQVESPTSTGFTITRGVLIPILPGFPFEEDAPDEFFGSGLTYENVTINGHTMATPITGVITSVREIGTDFATLSSGFVLQASDFYAVTLTPGNNDNKLLLRDLFSGRDLLKGTTKGDKFDGFDGNDRVFGRGGDDKLFGGKGNDKLFGGKGNDKLFGDGGKDQIDGGKGNDQLKGGAGTDIFVFKGKSAGQDTIRDFVVGVETIRIKAKGIDDFSDLSISYGGGDAVIDYGATKITVLNVANNGLDADDFLF